MNCPCDNQCLEECELCRDKDTADKMRQLIKSEEKHKKLNLWRDNDKDLDIYYERKLKKFDEE